MAASCWVHCRLRLSRMAGSCWVHCRLKLFRTAGSCWLNREGEDRGFLLALL